MGRGMGGGSRAILRTAMPGMTKVRQLPGLDFVALAPGVVCTQGSWSGSVPDFKCLSLR
jgi:hypothetical protein